MEMNDKMKRLLDMTEHPERFSEEEMKELLADDECRAYYELMVKTDNAYTEFPKANADQALKVFEAKHIHLFSWSKIAAVIVSVVMLSGLAYAAISLSRRTSASEEKSVTSTKEAIVNKGLTVRGNIEEHDSITVKDKLFDDVELQTILSDIATFYKVKIEYRSEATKHLRLHFRWDKTQNIEAIVEILNHFEKVNIILADGKMEIE